MDFQQQIYSLEELLVKRDETIKEYEEKVKELVFQNAELLESIETKDKEIANNEVILHYLIILVNHLHLKPFYNIKHYDVTI